MAESGDGSFIVQKTTASELRLFGRRDGEGVEAPILYGVRAGNKCYMLPGGSTFDNLNDLVDAVKEKPTMVKWAGKADGFAVPLTHPAEFSDAVKAMADVGDAVKSAHDNAGSTEENSDTNAIANEPEPELTEEEKHRRHIEEQMKVCLAIIYLVPSSALTMV